MKKFAVVFALIFCAMFVCQAQEIYSRMNSRTLLRLMRNEGYSVSLDNEADINWKKDGVKFNIIFHDGNKEETNFYFRCSYEIDENKIANALFHSNEFNINKKFGKSYVLKKSVVFTMTLNLRGGVTKARIIDFLDDCLVVVKVWKKDVVDKI